MYGWLPDLKYRVNEFRGKRRNQADLFLGRIENNRWAGLSGNEKIQLYAVLSDPEPLV